MAKTTIKSESNNLYIRRYLPEGIFADGTGFSKQPTIEQTKDKYNKHPSITDKESFRLSLVSARGAISSLTQEAQKGLYMFPDGKYDKSKDISYILRKDLSITEIDEYIFKRKQQLAEVDDELAVRVESEIAQLEAKKAELETKNKENSSGEKSE